MPLSSIELRDFWRNALVEPKLRECYWLRQAVIASLSPQQKRIFAILMENPGRFYTSTEIAAALKKSVNSIDNELQRIYDLDLLVKIEQRNAHGLHFEYAVYAAL